MERREELSRRIRLQLSEINRLINDEEVHACMTGTGIAVGTGLGTVFGVTPPPAGVMSLVCAHGLAGFFGATGAVSLYFFVQTMRKLLNRYQSRRRFNELLQNALGEDPDAFIRQNPLATITRDSEGSIAIINPDGSPAVGTREGSEAQRDAERMERERAGAGRREAPVREEEELGVPNAGAGTGLGPRPPRATIRRLVDDSRRGRYPALNPAYEAAARGGYPRVGAVDDERKEEEQEEEKEEEDEDGAPAEGNFFARQQRRNPFYMGMRGLPRED
jgi:hypothetical protein